MGDLEGKLGTEEASLLGNIGSIATVINKLLAEGVSAATVAEHIAAVIDPALAPALSTLISVLQEAEKLLGGI